MTFIYSCCEVSVILSTKQGTDINRHWRVHVHPNYSDNQYVFQQLILQWLGSTWSIKSCMCGFILRNVWEQQLRQSITSISHHVAGHHCQVPQVFVSQTISPHTIPGDSFAHAPYAFHQVSFSGCRSRRWWWNVLFWWDGCVPLGLLGVVIIIRAFLRAARGYYTLKNVLVYRQVVLDSLRRQWGGVTAQRTHYPQYGNGSLRGSRERQQAALTKRVFAAQVSRTPPTDV